MSLTVSMPQNMAQFPIGTAAMNLSLMSQTVERRAGQVVWAYFTWDAVSLKGASAQLNPNLCDFESGQGGALDALDKRFTYLAALKDGWLDGHGSAPAKDGLAWVYGILRSLIERHGLPKPQVAPSPEGDVVAEWSADGWEIGVDFDLASKKAHLSAVSLTSDETISEEWTNGMSAAIEPIVAFVARHLGRAM